MPGYTVRKSVSRWLFVAQHEQLVCRNFRLSSRSYATHKLKDDAALRVNPVGIQYLSPALQSQVFPGKSRRPSDLYVELAKLHLQKHDLSNRKTTQLPSYNFRLPALQGKNLTEHFETIGRECAEPHLTNAQSFGLVSLPSIPKKWLHQPGWTRYGSDGTVEQVPYPKEAMLVFDVEVLYKVSDFAVLAIAASPNAWYCWLSPWLLGKTEQDRHLIPLRPEGHLIIGHHISFDRQRILQEYNLTRSNNSFIDTMSLHVATNGMCSRQKPTWLKAKKAFRQSISKESDDSDEGPSQNEFDYENFIEQEPWLRHVSVNSLKDVAKFHCDIDMSKETRDLFSELDKGVVLQHLDEAISYCAFDVHATHKVYQKVLPQFLEVCPHPSTFAAMLLMSTSFLPVNNSWKRYINNAEDCYKSMSNVVIEKLSYYAEQMKDLQGDDNAIAKDPWLRQLDWSPCKLYRKPAKSTVIPPVVPKWYKAVYEKNLQKAVASDKSRLAPILLRLQWEGHPLVWSNVHGWVFEVEKNSQKDIDDLLRRKFFHCSCDPQRDPILKAESYAYFKIPHKDGPEARCGSPLSKTYQSYFEDGILTSKFEIAKNALEMSTSCSYWRSARDRIKSQMVVWEKDVQFGLTSQPDGFGMILPKIIPMGTVTRRAVENTWLTASNAKKNRLGSELKAMVCAPEGYTFVGADVDSEELWIVAVIGDSQFSLHGATALSWMTLEGKKSEGTDLHSKTAAILGVSRDAAKVFNYGRLYGAGLKHTALLLKQFNSSLDDTQAANLAKALYKSTKGVRSEVSKRLLAMGIPEHHFWSKGSESFVFNKLESMAQMNFPRTPVLNAGITQALSTNNLSRSSFMTSRVNWAIQSSAVDYLHLLVVSMEHLIRKYNLEARLSLTVHDEVRYFSTNKDRFRVALALQVANLWTRSFFCHRLGIDELPQSVAFFSSVDIDHVLRKDVKMDCVTPSNPTPIPSGEEYNIDALLCQLAENHQCLESLESVPIDGFPEDETIVSKEEDLKALAYLKAQAFH
ncbi:mitochondrial DNA polymerase, gamma subunit Pog1 [Schizosaccharomyces osmophilus]|uniref:Mitochondrial DNA polymerase catalytic subunit n=1 Tax=Schizosaccharomyces osmophilus TaxID=2545709 RepID=A0AAE9WE85_9SCHI|nr:mitochondrial DNA polymerase, gamma subunit Pog1 [Schizosaccharomyces osmophilus]WBW74669.1 mitochondrial DNA polymerase, gamma subunit Pog1 [Schizosaccharomyces osmophilus]